MIYIASTIHDLGTRCLSFPFDILQHLLFQPQTLSLVTFFSTVDLIRTQLGQPMQLWCAPCCSTVPPLRAESARRHRGAVWLGGFGTMVAARAVA